MSDWDYPARTFSINRMTEILNLNKFNIIAKYGLIHLTNSLILEKRYSMEYDKILFEKYKQIELELSRKSDCMGMLHCSNKILKRI